MAGPNDKRRMLDDEMSRFEAEISGPTSIDPMAPQPVSSGLDMRPIIGSNTFAQVKQQLKQAADDVPLQPPPGPPSFNGGAGPQVGSYGMQNQSEPHREGGPIGSQEPRPGPPGPGSFGPRPPPGFNQGQFRPGMNRPGPPGHGPGPPGHGPRPPGHGPGPPGHGPGPPGHGPGPPGHGPGPPGHGPGPPGHGPGPPGHGPGPPGHGPGPPGHGPGPLGHGHGPGPPGHGHGPGPPGHGHGPGPHGHGPGPGPGPFGPNMGPRGGPPSNSFPPPPPGYMGPPHGRGGGGSNFPPGGMAPPPPPGFIPPQVNRAAMNSMGPGMNMGSNSMGGSIGPRPPASFLRPPPPPPGLVGQRMPQNIGSPKGPPNATISKAPAVISSAPKLYTAQAKENKDENEEKKCCTPSVETKKIASEPKKKKQKTENKTITDSQKKEISHAVEMAERVKQSITTTKQTAQSYHQTTPQEERKKEKKSKKNLRYAGGQIWEDPCLTEWDSDDFRMFAGDLGNDVTDELLHRYFSHYASFIKAKVVRDKRTNKSKGYGFISFKDSQDYIRAMKEMNGKYLGSRPIKLRKSMWKDRNLDVVQKKLKEKQLSGLK